VSAADDFVVLSKPSGQEVDFITPLQTCWNHDPTHLAGRPTAFGFPIRSLCPADHPSMANVWEPRSIEFDFWIAIWDSMFRSGRTQA